MEVLVRWDDGVQNIVPSTDLRKLRQTNKNWKRTRFTQQFKEGDRIKMWYDDKWFFGVIVFVDRARILSDYPSALPPETLINKDASLEEKPIFNDDTNGSGKLNIEDACVEGSGFKDDTNGSANLNIEATSETGDGLVFNDDTNGSGNLNIVLSEPFTLEESFNFNEKDFEESNENNSSEEDKTLNELKIDIKGKNVSAIRTRRKQYVPVKLSTRKTYNSYKDQVKTKTTPPDNTQATSKTIPSDLVLKPCSVVVDDSVAKRLRVSDTFRVCKGEVRCVGSAFTESELVAEPVVTKKMEKNPSKKFTTTVTRASLKRSNQKYELLELSRRRNAPKRKRCSTTEKPSHLSKKRLEMNFFEQNLLKLLNKNQSTMAMKKEKVGIIENIVEKPHRPTSDDGESSGGVMTKPESCIKNNINKTPDQETILTETGNDLPKKTCANKTEQAIGFGDEIKAKKARMALTTAECLDQNMSMVNCKEQIKKKNPQSSRTNENNVMRIPPEVALKDSSDGGKMSTTITGSSINENNKTGEKQPISVQAFIKDPKTKSVISEADLADIRRKTKPNVKSDSSNVPKTTLEFTRSLVPFIPPVSNVPKTKLEFTRSLVPFIPPVKYSETVFSSVQTKQPNLDTCNKNKLIFPSTKLRDKEILNKSSMTSNSSERNRPTAKSQRSVNYSHLPQTSDSEMTLNDLLNSTEVTEIAGKSINKSEELQEENTSDSVLTLEELLKSGDAVSLDHKYNELKERLSSPSLLLSRTKKIIHPPKPVQMNNSTNRKTSNQLIENKNVTNSLQTSNNSRINLENPNQITGLENGLKEVGKPTEPDVEECLDGVPPFIRDVFECGNIRDGFIASDLVFVLSLLPDVEEMTDSQKIKFQVKVIEMLNDVMNDPHLTYC